MADLSFHSFWSMGKKEVWSQIVFFLSRVHSDSYHQDYSIYKPNPYPLQYSFYTAYLNF